MLPFVVPPPRVLQAFRVAPECLRRLPGGQGQAFATPDSVLKPVLDADEASWIAEVLDGLPEEGFRVARPLRAQCGDWVVDGWSAWRFIAGRHDFRGRWPEIVELCRRLNGALRTVKPTPIPNPLETPFTVADGVAWDERCAELAPPVTALYRQLKALTREPTAPAQLVHGDLSGNVLFAESVAPGVIDFSPYWRPASYAVAIVVVDALAWHRASPSLVYALERPELEHLARAAIFRLVVAALRHTNDPPALAHELAKYRRVAELIEGLERA